MFVSLLKDLSLTKPKYIKHPYLDPETAKQLWNHHRWWSGRSETRNTGNCGSCRVPVGYFGHSIFQSCRQRRCPHHESEGSQSCSWCCSPGERKGMWFAGSKEEKREFEGFLSFWSIWNVFISNNTNNVPSLSVSLSLVFCGLVGLSTPRNPFYISNKQQFSANKVWLNDTLHTQNTGFCDSAV